MNDVNRTNGPAILGDVIAAEAKGILVDDLMGKRDWESSKFGYVTGISSLASSVRGIVGLASSSIFGVFRLGQAVISRERVDNFVELDEPDPDARFLAAMDAYEKTEEDLEMMARNSHRGFYFYAILLSIGIAMGIASLRLGNFSGMPTIVDVALRFATVPALTALMIRFGYLNWIVRTKSLRGLGSYIASGDFFPTRTVRGAVAIALLGLLLATGIILSPDAAYAADAAPRNAVDILMEPHEDDLFVNMLEFVVPGIGPIEGNPTLAHKAIAAGFMAFSTVLMLLGSLMLSWHVLVGIVASAYSGRILGERWHQIWAPVRVVIGLGSLAPIAGGYGAVQVLVIYLIVMGGNLANAVWTPYITELANGIKPVTADTVTDRMMTDAFKRLAGADDVIYQIALREICNATGNRHLALAYGGDDKVPSSQRSAIASATSLEFTATPRIGDMLDTVGSFFEWTFSSLDPTTTSAPPAIDRTTYTLDYGTLCGGISMQVDTINSGTRDTTQYLHAESAVNFDNARKNSVEYAISQIRPLAKKIAETYNVAGGSSQALSEHGSEDLQRDLAVSLKKQIEKYSVLMSKAAQEQVEALDVSANNGGRSLVSAFTEQATQKGWAVAGAYYVTLAQVQSAVYGKAMDGPEFSNLNIDSSSTPRSDNLTAVLVGTPESPGALPAFESWWRQNFNSSFSKIDLTSTQAGLSDENRDSWFSTIIRSIGTDTMLPFGLKLLGDLDPFNPMKSMIDFGHFILMGFYLVMSVLLVGGLVGLGGGAAGVAASAGIKLLSSAIANSSMGSIVISFVGMLLFAIFSVGVVHAYIIPMIPYMQVLFFLLGMMVLLVEALIAAPLWAFFHIRMEGHELIDQAQKPGYMIAFNLLLRPSLMILGLMMSFFIFGAMAWFINNTITLAATAAGSDHSIGPIGTIVMICLVTYLHYQVALRSFGLINQVPDRVTRWFGQHGEGLGEENENTRALGFIVGNVANRTEALSRAGGVGTAARRGGVPGRGAGAGGAAGRKGGGSQKPSTPKP